MRTHENLRDIRKRTLIIGNSGSGKSTVAERLGSLIGASVFDLDLAHWKDEGYGAKRDEAVAKQTVAEIAAKPRWIIEGVYGWLAEAAAPRATALIWLDMPWKVCREGLIARGLRRGETEKEFSELLDWAEAYSDRKSSSSFQGHLKLFENFTGTKFRLADRASVDALLANLRT